MGNDDSEHNEKQVAFNFGLASTPHCALFEWLLIQLDLSF